MISTHEGAPQFEHSLSHALEFFSKAGSQFANKQSFYQNEESALSLFQKTWIVDKPLSFKLLLWLRDCRGGAGNRSGFRQCVNWLAKNGGKEWINANLHWIPLAGRWDDLKALFKTPAEKQAAMMWAGEIKDGNILAAKWCDRKDFPVKHAMGLKKEGDFRKLLAGIRKNHIVEHKMATGLWNDIEYSKVPSVAMARYTKAFSKNDQERFEQFKQNLKSGKEKINAGVLFPHDCARTAMHGDTQIADEQFAALPNFLEGPEGKTSERIIVLSDTSGSMQTTISGAIQAIHVSQGLALYCSEKIGEGNPFYKKFIGFCSEAKFKDWNGLSFSQAVRDHRIFDGAVGSTRIDLALNAILDTAKFFNVQPSQMPTTLLIVSDMQFSAGVNSRNTPVRFYVKAFEDAGYIAPKIVYWDLCGYPGATETMHVKNVAMVSGFSPSILKAVFSGTDFSPEAIMLRALEKYAIQIPQAA